MNKAVLGLSVVMATFVLGALGTAIMQFVAAGEDKAAKRSLPGTDVEPDAEPVAEPDEHSTPDATAKLVIPAITESVPEYILNRKRYQERYYMPGQVTEKYKMRELPADAMRPSSEKNKQKMPQQFKQLVNKNLTEYERNLNIMAG